MRGLYNFSFRFQVQILKYVLKVCFPYSIVFSFISQLLTISLVTMISILTNLRKHHFLVRETRKSVTTENIPTTNRNRIQSVSKIARFHFENSTMKSGFPESVQPVCIECMRDFRGKINPPNCPKTLVRC